MRRKRLKTSKFQKRHYEAVAALLANQNPGINWDGYDMWEKIVWQFCEDFKEDNPNFNIHKFLEACGHE